ncbi:glutathione S-transferase Ure2-like protein [Eremomyces bilateralis CBS 781.70]|uniref:glutathione transferase n=1 Tax=Eremomyces bilateralis CBS 781.70 TaxID=1392243 RepID=A0A6G1FZ03_9PEZI|nr:glutathione S-transferase Ure2-like protein [Eremomyces bilateralis CBS 781.70]KAF1810789.1 glutathione S-transferase Ure2-like protein [Eremomyces bilateralis CBS 781.70]
MKPIILYGHHAGPNPKKVVMVLEELNIPYEVKLLKFPEMKQPAYEKINPNGRVPAIEDPNTGITLWESAAIIEYLVEKYDENRTISFPPGTPEYYYAKQWLHFQASGQGPYFGQAVWFKIHHKEHIQSAFDRYINEIRRVSGVLNGVLEGHQYLVNDTYSYADTAFIPWFDIIPWLAGDAIDLKKDFPNVHAWLNTLKSRPAVITGLGKVKSEAPKKL